AKTSDRSASIAESSSLIGPVQSRLSRTSVRTYAGPHLETVTAVTVRTMWRPAGPHSTTETHDDALRRTRTTALNARCARRHSTRDTRSVTQPRRECDTPVVAKVAIIGAGSVEFTRNILTDLSSVPE